MANETSFEIRLGGLVLRPRQLGLDALKGARRASVGGRLNCPPATYPGNGVWEGAVLAALLEDAGIRAEARFVTIGSGSFITTFALESLERRGAILADTLDGRALPPEAGGPVRLMFAAGACFDTIKSVEFIDLTEDQSRATVRGIIRGRHDERLAQRRARS